MFNKSLTHAGPCVEIIDKCWPCKMDLRKINLVEKVKEPPQILTHMWNLKKILRSWAHRKDRWSAEAMKVRKVK